MKPVLIGSILLIYWKYVRNGKSLRETAKNLFLGPPPPLSKWPDHKKFAASLTWAQDRGRFHRGTCTESGSCWPQCPVWWTPRQALDTTEDSNLTNFHELGLGIVETFWTNIAYIPKKFIKYSKVINNELELYEFLVIWANGIIQKIIKLLYYLCVRRF